MRSLRGISRPSQVFDKPQQQTEAAAGAPASSPQHRPQAQADDAEQRPTKGRGKGKDTASRLCGCFGFS